MRPDLGSSRPLGGGPEGHGPAAGDGLGCDGAGLGDTNGEGLLDILLGAPGDDSAGENAGAAYLLLGGGSVLGAL